MGDEGPGTGARYQQGDNDTARDQARASSLTGAATAAVGFLVRLVDLQLP
jgi:hypothetical protein